MNESQSLTVSKRKIWNDKVLLELSNNQEFIGRRYLPIGKNDEVKIQGEGLSVFIRQDKQWIDIANPWKKSEQLDLGGVNLSVTFKEIETDSELAQFRELRKFHYRGAGGAGRSVPIIATTNLPDLPNVIGFIELTSSMIANTARKRLFAGPYREKQGISWHEWDSESSRKYCSLICRISRFVIHPELRGLGLARPFSDAARSFAGSKWHYGGRRARFLEITAEMLRYYPFLNGEFQYAGETEGNQHRVKKDMNYLVKKALSPQGKTAMPQGGGGIMTLQRSYAMTMIDHMQAAGASLEEAIEQLQYDPSQLDQDAWEALYKLNRRPKPCYIAGVTPSAAKYVKKRALACRSDTPYSHMRSKDQVYNLSNIGVKTTSNILQTNEGRLIQDAFGFVGSHLESDVQLPSTLSLRQGNLTLICGGSGSGKSLLLEAIRHSFSDNPVAAPSSVVFGGEVDAKGLVETLPNLDFSKAPLDYIGKNTLDCFLEIAGRCGLAEPQLLVRPISSLSSGQRYRLQIAIAACRRPDVLLIDNFCEPLDRFSMRAVCKGLKSLSNNLGFTTVAATAAHERLEDFLHPQQIVMLRRGAQPTIS